jgi:hypothetical protein
MDLRLPLGLLFTSIGALLTVYGALTPAELYARSFGTNLNIWSGLAMFVFGAAMLVLARRGAPRHR